MRIGFFWLVHLAFAASAAMAGGHGGPYDSEIRAEVNPRRRDYLRKEKDIYAHCLKPKFQTAHCAYFPHRTPLLVDSKVMKAMFVSVDIQNKTYDAVSDAAKSCAVYAFVPKDEAYWIQQEIETDYARLKCTLAAKKKKERLTDCQAACVATCISMRLIDYVDGGHQSAKAAVCSGKGTCREFSSIAEELLRSMGLDATRAFGTLYDERPDSKKEVVGHVMVQVTLDGKPYLMDPQDDACAFYSPKFNPNPSRQLDQVEYLQETAP